MSRCRTRRRCPITKRSTPSGTSLPTSVGPAGAASRNCGSCARAAACSQVLPQNFKDTWRYSAGVNYYYDEKTVLRAGIAYDQSPVNNVDRWAASP